MFEPYQLGFLKDLGESVAAAVASHRITLNTHRLLEQTQKQVEELRAQEEGVARKEKEY